VVFLAGSGFANHPSKALNAAFGLILVLFVVVEEAEVLRAFQR
jgi:hypothetical protein